MLVNAMLIPATTQAGSAATQLPSSVSTSFGATLASSMSGSEPQAIGEKTGDATFDSTLEAKFEAKSEIESETKFEAKSEIEFSAKSEAASLVELAGNSAAHRGSASSLPALLVTSIATSKPAPAPNLTDPGSDPHAVAQQLTGSPASGAVTGLPLPLSLPIAPLASAPLAHTLAGGSLLEQHDLGLPSSVVSTVSLVAIPQTTVFSTSNSSQGVAVPVPANSAVPIEVRAKLSDRQVAFRDNVSGAAQPSAALAQFSTLQAPSFTAAASTRNLPTPAGSTADSQTAVSTAATAPTPGPSMSVTLDSPTLPISASPTITSLLATASAESQFSAPTSDSETVSATDQSSTIQVPLTEVSVSRVPAMQSLFVPAGSPSAMLLASAAPLLNDGSLAIANDFSVQRIASPASDQSLVPRTDAAADIVSPIHSVPATTLTAAILPATSAPTLQLPVGDENLVTFTELPAAILSSAPKSSDAKFSPSTSGNPISSNSISDDSTAGNSTVVGSSAAERATSGSVTLDAVSPAQALTLDTATAARTASPSETASAVANHLTGSAANAAPNDASNNNASSSTSAPTSNVTGNVTSKAAASVTSNVTSNVTANATSTIDSNLTGQSDALDPTLASMAATGSDAPSNDKAGVSAQPSPAASQASAADKKSVGVQTATASLADVAQNISAAAVSGKDPALAIAAPAAPAALPAFQAGSAAAAPLPQAQQMLDSAPPAPSTPPSVPNVPGSAVEQQMNAEVNAQMHVGIRTEAFGAVEIHTVVQQSQVGLTVHSDRDIARWFSSEVPGLESGLNKSHLNLTGVNFDSGRSGVQTATGFQQGQQRQSFSQTAGSPYGASQHTLSGEEPVSESATVDILPSDAPVGSELNRVSIHV